MLASRYCLSMKLRIVTWNIHKGVGGMDRRYELDRIVRLLREVDPDIALLQEVAEGWPAARFASAARRVEGPAGIP